jgi:N12 class adenine-specific DNA methylase
VLFGVPPSSIEVGHLQKDAVWSLESGHQAEQSVAATAEYGTPRINGTTLLKQARNLKMPLIYDTVYDANGEERIVNQEATLAGCRGRKQALVAFPTRSRLSGARSSATSL